MQREQGDPEASAGAAIGRLPSLDGLRAVSIAMVLAYHVGATTGVPPGVSRWLLRVSDGPLGVRVFFVVSGYLITHLMLREHAGTGRVSLAGFYRRRAVRILPVYWAFLAAAATLAVARQVPFPAGHLWQPLTFTTGLWPSMDGSTGHTWSLSVEEQFYLLWPVTFASAGPAGRLAIVAAAAVLGPVARAALYVTHHHQLYRVCIFGHIDTIAYGCGLALVLDRWPGACDRAVAWSPAAGRAAAVALIAGLSALHRTPYQSWFTVPFLPAIQAVATAYLIASLTRVRRGWSFRALNVPAVARVGVLSYGIYVWQQPFLCEPPTTAASRLWRTWPANLPLALAAAAASYVLVERPLLRFKRPGTAERPGDVPTGSERRD